MKALVCRVNGVEHTVRPLGVDVLSLERSIEVARATPTRYSLLKHFQDSPRAYLIELMKAAPRCESLAEKLGAGLGPKKSDALRMGTAVHQLVLCASHRVVTFDGVRSGARWETFERDHTEQGHTIVNTREWLEVGRMAETILRSEKACELLFGGCADVETPITWELRGKRISSTPDSRQPGIVVDLKTTRDSSPGAFVKQVYGRLYHAQLECYARAIEYETGTRPETAYIVAVDRVLPARCYRISDEGLRIGARLIGSWIEQLTVCEASRNFPYLEVCEAAPPSYLLEESEFSDLPDDLITEEP